MNLTTFRVWCYACEKEVFPEQRLTAHLPGSSPRFSEQVRRCRRIRLIGDMLGVGQCDPSSVQHRLVGPGWRRLLVTIPRWPGELMSVQTRQALAMHQGPSGAMRGLGTGPAAGSSQAVGVLCVNVGLG